MSPVPPPAKALVTGANGYIAVWVVRTLLEDGYSVTGTVRTASKGDHLKKLFATYGDKFNIAIVDDITKPGAFDEVVKDVQLVEHTASPFHMNVKTTSDLIDPAVRGTTGILESIKKYGSSVRRVVVTSSTAAVQHPVPEYTVFDENSWDEHAIEEVNAKGDATEPVFVYRASKTMAEKAAWEFVKSNPDLAWDLVVLNPPFVFGPPIHEVSSLSALNTSMQTMYDTLVKGAKDTAAMTAPGGSWIDVRDVARAHALAAQKAEAGNNRIIISAGTFFWQDIVDAAVDNGDEPAVKGDYGATKGKTQLINYNPAKGIKILGMQYINVQKMVKDTMAYFKGF